MRRVALTVAAATALACGDTGSQPADGSCPSLPEVVGLCLGITYDSLKTLRPGVFRDSDGVREVASDSFQAVYYFSSRPGAAAEVLVGVRLELSWLDSAETARRELQSRLSIDMTSTESGVIRMRDAWTRDSVDVPATRWRRVGMETVVRWDVLSPRLDRRQVNVWAFAPGSPPASLGRWLN